MSVGKEVNAINTKLVYIESGGSSKGGWEGGASEVWAMVGLLCLQKEVKERLQEAKSPVLPIGQVIEDWKLTIGFANNLHKVKDRFDSGVKAKAWIEWIQGRVRREEWEVECTQLSEPLL